MRKENILVLKDTLDTFQKGYYVIDEKIKNCKLTYKEIIDCQVYLPEDIETIDHSKEVIPIHEVERMKVECLNMDSYSLARKLDSQKDIKSKPVLVLNLANSVHPGGGVRRGAKAQEEDLCRKSSLLLSLEGEYAQSYYDYNRKLQTRMGSDAIIITPQVEIIKDEKGHYLDESVIVSVMTCAAPCLSYGMEGLSKEQYESMLYKRIVGMLKVAAYEGYEYFVLGAFGCGAFDNDAHIVSNLFYKALKEFNFDDKKAEFYFRRIGFAVFDRTSNQYNFNEFSRNFNHFN